MKGPAATKRFYEGILHPPNTQTLHEAVGPAWLVRQSRLHDGMATFRAKKGRGVQCLRISDFMVKP